MLIHMLLNHHHSPCAQEKHIDKKLWHGVGTPEFTVILQELFTQILHRDVRRQLRFSEKEEGEHDSHRRVWNTS